MYAAGSQTAPRERGRCAIWAADGGVQSGEGAGEVGGDTVGSGRRCTERRVRGGEKRCDPRGGADGGAQSGEDAESRILILTKKST